MPPMPYSRIPQKTQILLSKDKEYDQLEIRSTYNLDLMPYLHILPHVEYLAGIFRYVKISKNIVFGDEVVL